MGVVYRANDPLLDKEVAIKVLTHKLSDRAALRFQTEAKATGKLSHENVVLILDFGVTSEQEPYMVMEFLDGTSLAELLEREKALPVSSCIDIFIQICRGLEHAHSRSLVHRDVKPSNVILVQREDLKPLVKLVDFGVAKILQSDQELTATHAVVGSPLYMAPEQIRSEDPDARSDIYSLGCLMYECLSGHRPIEGENALETMSLVEKIEPERVSRVADQEIPIWLDELVMRCLRKAKEDRFQAVSEISAILVDRKRDGEREARVVSGAKQVLDTPLASNPMPPLKFIVIPLVVIIAGLFLGMRFTSHREEPREEKASSQREMAEISDYKETLIDTSDQVMGRRVAKMPKVTTNEKAAFSQNGHILNVMFARDADLKECQKYKTATEIQIESDRIDGSGLKYISGMKLEGLDLKGCPLKDQYLKDLTKLAPIKVIRLEHIKTLSGDGFEYWRDMDVNEVCFRHGNITDLAMKNISEIRKLELISLRRSEGLTFENLSYLRKIPNLRKVNLDSTGIDDHALSALAGIKTLRDLKIHNNPLTTACFATIESLPALQKLDFYKCENIDQKEIDQLAKKLGLELELSASGHPTYVKK